jgi:hypothetical protein
LVVRYTPSLDPVSRQNGKPCKRLSIFRALSVPLIRSRLLPEAYRGVAFSRGACPKHPANLTKTRLSSKHTLPKLHARYGPPASVWWTLFVTMFFTLLFGFPINKAFESIASWFFPQHSARSIISLTYVYPLMALAFIWYGLMECIASYWARERYHVARPKYFT